MDIEDKHKISVEDIKGKYFKSGKLELRNKLIEEVLKYKVINQVEPEEFLRISSHLVFKSMKQ